LNLPVRRRNFSESRKISAGWGCQKEGKAGMFIITEAYAHEKDTFGNTTAGEMGGGPLRRFRSSTKIKENSADFASKLILRAPLKF
jgi:hypothetical protein